MSTMYNIVEEANSNLRTDGLNIGNYTTYIIDDEGKLFENIGLDYLDKFYNLLNNNIKEISFDTLFNYKPEYVSYKLYGTASYDYLILHANKLTSKKEFLKKNFINGKIKYYTKDVIDKVVSELRSFKKGEPETIKIENYLLYKI